MNIYEKALNKVLVIIGIKKDSKIYYYAGTRNKQIIEFCGGDKNIIFETHSDDKISFYDLKNNCTEEILLNNDSLFEFTIPCIPFEISPPMYLVPEIENEENNKKLIAFQKDLFEYIKQRKNIEEFKTNEANQDVLNKCLYFLHNAKYNEITQGLLLDIADNFYYFKLACDPVIQKQFNEQYSKFYEIIHFKPILNFLGYSFKSVEELEEILKNNLLEIKTKWASFLDKKRNDFLQQLTINFENEKKHTTDVNVLNILNFQYDERVKLLNSTNFIDVLDKINDLRIALRYCPEYIDTGFYKFVDSYDSLDLRLINCLICNDILKTKQEYTEIFEKGLNVFCELRLDILKEKRKQQIINKKEELIKHYENLSSENMLNEDTLLNHLYSLQNYKDVLSFWPPVLTPVPNYVLLD
jgi:hypothetical protein